MNKAPKLRFKEFSGEWESKKLGSLLEFKNGINASKEQYGHGKKFINILDILSNDYITYENIIGKVDVDDDTFDKYSVGYGDVIFQRSSETREEVGTANVYLDKEYKATFGGFIIRGKKLGEYNPIFMNKLLKTSSARKEITTKSGGSTRYNVGQETLSDVEVMFPKLEEQEKIASFLSLIDNKISLQGNKVDALKDYKKGMVQKIFSRELRFKNDEGRDYPEWKHKKLSNIVTRVTRKNKEIQSTLPLTISAQYGLVDQITFFNKTVASSNLEGYYLLEKGEFAYNKSYSTGYPFGAIKRLDRYDKGVLSSLYICFSVLENIDSDFLVQYFETSYWHKEISMVAVEGARNHGLLNISVTDFFETYHWIPSYEEQIKIGQFLGSLDMKLRKEQEKLDSLNEYKKGLLQQMFV